MGFQMIQKIFWILMFQKNGMLSFSKASFLLICVVLNGAKFYIWMTICVFSSSSPFPSSSFSPFFLLLFLLLFLFLLLSLLLLFLPLSLLLLFLRFFQEVKSKLEGEKSTFGRDILRLQDLLERERQRVAELEDRVSLT